MEMPENCVVCSLLPMPEQAEHPNYAFCPNCGQKA